MREKYMYENVKPAHIIARNLVVFCGVLAVLVATAHAEFVCPSGSEISTASAAETCVCEDGLPIQSIRPEDISYCTSHVDNAKFIYDSLCGMPVEGIEFTRLSVTATCSLPNEDPKPPFFRGTFVSGDKSTYLYITCEEFSNGNKYVIMYYANTYADPHYKDEILTYQLVQNENEINTANWTDLCFLPQAQIGAHVCPINMEDDFEGGCTACNAGLSKRAGNHMCQCDSTETECVCTACKNEESTLKFGEYPNFCGCSHNDTHTGTYTSWCPESFDAKVLTDMYVNKNTVSYDNCIEFV